MAIRAPLFTAVLLAAAAASACGGGKKAADTTPSDEVASAGGGGGGDGDEASQPEPDSGGSIVQPELMDEIQRRFDRKRAAVSRCLSAAIDAKELPKNSRGKITLNVVIAPSGQASDVKIVKASLESPRLHECVIDKVKEIPFPEVPQPFPTSYTYGFEAM